MSLTRLDVALVAAAATGLIWIEHDHRVVTGSLDAAEVPAVSVCPKTDDAPYSAECIKFISGGVAPATHSGSAARAELRCPPGSKGAPDGDSCISNLPIAYAHPDRY